MRGLSATDVGVLLAATLVVTVVGRALAGRVRTRRDFFEAGGSLPWWAVSSSIIATAVSSVTFISVPAAVFRDGGNLGYVQVLLGLMLGTILLARLGIGDVRSYASGFVAAAAAAALMSYTDVGFFWWCPGSALVMIVMVAGVQRKPIEPSGFVL